jgi:methanogenic corrinoid protein MtbC1/DNA-binding XRE family transcriptional regulator
MSGFAARLRELRTDAGLRQKDLADALGVAQTTVANYEQGARFPDEKLLGRVADYFDVSLDFLMGRIDLKTAARDGTNFGGFFAAEQETLAPMSALARRYLELLVAGKREEAGRLVHEAVDPGHGVREIYRSVFERTLKEIGVMWRQEKLDVATEHYFSASTQLIMSQLYPRITAASSEDKKERVCLAMAVCGEFHEIGARMISDFLEMDGWKSFFMGSNLCNEDIIKALLDHEADLLALSATMFFNVESVARAVRSIRAVPALKDLVILVGGRPFNQEPDLWKKVKADGFARDADEALRLADRLAESPGSGSPRVGGEVNRP